MTKIRLREKSRLVSYLQNRCMYRCRFMRVACPSVICIIWCAEKPVGIPRCFGRWQMSDILPYDVSWCVLVGVPRCVQRLDVRTQLHTLCASQRGSVLRGGRDQRSCGHKVTPRLGKERAEMSQVLGIVRVTRGGRRPMHQSSRGLLSGPYHRNTWAVSYIFEFQHRTVCDACRICESRPQHFDALSQSGETEQMYWAPAPRLCHAVPTLHHMYARCMRHIHVGPCTYSRFWRELYSTVSSTPSRPQRSAGALPCRAP